ncbi:MAG: class I SAM-dependent methyltransferase [Pseudomonadota bacterium]
MNRDPSSIQARTDDWLQTSLGSALLEREKALVGDALESIFGIQLLQVGAWGANDSFVGLGNTRRAALVAPQAAEGVSIRSEPSRLGIASDSVDIVLLPHTLEYDPAPHDVLREVERVLVGEGHLVLLGFNPVGPVGLRRLLSFRGYPAGLSRLYTEGRVRDWLKLLGLDVVDARRYFFTAPVNSARLQQRLSGIETVGSRYWSKLSGAYMLVARKRVFTLTPVRPVWSRRRGLVGGLAKPSAMPSRRQGQSR